MDSRFLLTVFFFVLKFFWFVWVSGVSLSLGNQPIFPFCYLEINIDISTPAWITKILKLENPPIFCLSNNSILVYLFLVCDINLLTKVFVDSCLA